MPGIVCKLDRSLRPWAMECGSEFHEALLSDLRVHKTKTDAEKRAAMFGGIEISERLTLGPWEVRAGASLFFSMRSHSDGSWHYDPPE